MGNKAWLTTASTRRSFPRLQEPGYDPARHTIACCNWGIPLLWLPLFRPADFVLEDIVAETGKTYRDPAPVVETSKALARLEEAVPRLNKVFHKQGELNRHAAQLSKAVASTRRAFVCLEVEELAWAGEPKEFYKWLEKALSYFDSKDSPKGRKNLLYLTPTVSEPDMPFPVPDAFRDREEAEVEDTEMLCFLLGEKWERPVPWEAYD